MTPQEMATREKQELAGQEKTRAGRYFMPQVDICEFEDYLKLWADMPGVGDKAVEVTLENNVLSIEGHIDTKIYEGFSPLYSEYNVGNYFRQFALNESIDESGIRATMRNGVLELTLPKVEKARPRKIEVKTS